MEIVKVKNKDGSESEHTIVNPKEDNCPVDEEKWGKEAVDFAESLDQPNRIKSKIDSEYLVAYRKAFEELGIKEVSNADVQRRVGELLATK